MKKPFYAEEADEGVEETDRAFENYMSYLECQDDNSVMSDSRGGYKSNDDKQNYQFVRAPQRGFSRRASSIISTASILNDVNESGVKAVSMDESLAWPKIFAVTIFCFSLGLSCVLIPTSIRYSRLLGKISPFGMYNNIPSFHFKDKFPLGKALLDNKQRIDERREISVFYELPGKDNAIIQNTFSNCIKYVEANEVSYFFRNYLFLMRFFRISVFFRLQYCHWIDLSRAK